MQRAILERHGMSGFGLRYEDIEPSLLWKLGNKIRRQDATFNANESQIFQALRDESGGVLRDALHLWLSSIQTMNASNDQLTICKPQSMPKKAIASLSTDALLALRQIARQGRLNAEDHAVHFQLNSTSSESHLAQLAHLRLIVCEEDGVYRLNRDVEGCIYRVLKEKEYSG